MQIEIFSCSRNGGYEYSSFSHKPYDCPDDTKIPLPDRVYEFYFKRDDFSEMLASEIIPHYCKQLGIENKDSVILVAHSLAAYPVLDIASRHSSDIGGVILASPALNQNQSTMMPDNPGITDKRLASLPIYMQIGQLEDSKPPQSALKQQDMRDESRLDANIAFHDQLKSRGYNVSEHLDVHAYGHSGIHVLQGIQQGLKYIDEHKPDSTQTMTFRV